MAAGWMRHLGGGAVDVFSAGSEPADQVNPAAVAAMHEVGIDIVGQHPQRWTDDEVRRARMSSSQWGVATPVPVFPGTRYVDWALDDPAGKPVEHVRSVRDEIERRVRALLGELGVTPGA